MLHSVTFFIDDPYYGDFKRLADRLDLEVDQLIYRLVVGDVDTCSIFRNVPKLTYSGAYQWCKAAVGD